MPEAACTSTQLHTQVSPDNFAAYWNASQAISGIQLAIGANSPYLLGKELWRETRIPLFEQATDTRGEELKEQGVRPRVWFGERWITSIFDLFEENVRYFPALLPITDDEDPLEVLESGGTPSLSELKLHNGTIYRWNRPVYDVVDGVPHLRVENRVLAAGPTVIDTMANAAFYFGLTRTLAEDDRPLWSRMSFSAAEENFHVGAQHGIDARVYWPGVGEVDATELVLRRLLPMAHEGLGRWGVESDEATRLLSIIEQRCILHRNGASWYVEKVTRARGGRGGPGGGAAADPAGVPPADARQRAGAHLAVVSPASPRLPVADPGPLPLLAADQVDPATPVQHEERRQRQPVPGERGPGRGEPLRVRIDQVQLAAPGDPGAGALGREQAVDRPLHQVGAQAGVVDVDVREPRLLPARMTDVAGRRQVSPRPGGCHELTQLVLDRGGERCVHGTTLPGVADGRVPSSTGHGRPAPNHRLA